jgi:hypothetical protein
MPKKNQLAKVIPATIRCAFLVAGHIQAKRLKLIRAKWTIVRSISRNCNMLLGNMDHLLHKIFDMIGLRGWIIYFSISEI